MNEDESAAAAGSVDEPFGKDGATVRLRDPKAMRALAHPLRLQLLGELRIRGPQTVGSLCAILDEPPGSISYHVGKLAEFGFVEPVPELARDRRERWWRARHEMTSVSPLEVLDDPERHAASDLLRRAIMQRYLERFEAYLAAEASMEREWVRGATSGDAFLQLTSEELLELRDEVNALVGRWQKRSDGDRDDARTVSLVYQLFRRP
jgi:DNA-binding transcriptional ArsR family regulator